MAGTEQFEFDVFISYSSKDQAWVRGELLTRIEQAGIKAFIDFRDFTRGAWSIKEMTRAVTICRKTLLILTTNYLDSEWCEHERLILQTLSAANRDLRLLPLLKSECELPLNVRGITHIDFTDGADQKLAWRQLLTSLGKPPDPEPPREPQVDQWFLAHPYPMPPNFTGRVAERALLSHWLNQDTAHPLLSLRALGGFGKSALVWHWLTHDVPLADWPSVVWWSFYETDATFDQFLVETLEYLSHGQIDVAQLSAKGRVQTLLQRLQKPGTLLVLDGFERVLRAFGGLDGAYQGDEVQRDANDRDCISPLAEDFLRHVASQPKLRSKVLLTTRLSPRVLEAQGGGVLNGACEEPLDQMQPADAVTFFQAQGIRGTHTEIETACAPYGYHPLSLRLLAGLIVNDFQQPGDIAAAKRLDVSGNLIQRQHHVLAVAYGSLSRARQNLLSRIACFRSSVKHDVLIGLASAGTTEASARERQGLMRRVLSWFRRRAPAFVLSTPGQLEPDLHDLVARGLLYHDKREMRFDMHPIVRRYAYDRLAAPDRAAAHTRLRDYFAAVPPPDKVTRLEDLAPVIELYHHTLRAGQLDEALTLFYSRFGEAIHYQLGAYQLEVELLRAFFPDGEECPPRLKDENAQAFVLNQLASSYSLNGQPRRAVPLFEQAEAISKKQGNEISFAIGLGAVASVALFPIGALRAAEANFRRRITLCREIKDELNEAVGHQELGRLLAYRGADAESGTELATALQMFEKENKVQGQGINWAYLALCELLRLRETASRGHFKFEISNFKSSLAAARRALELADENARSNFPLERDYVRAHWLLGAAYRVAGQPDEAERHLHDALERCRRINCVDAEADILIDLARLRAATGAAEEAQRLAEEARVIAERSGYVLQGADAHLELARLAMVRHDQAAARAHAEQAKALATCDGPPDYTYAAAYAEANALLAELS